MQALNYSIHQKEDIPYTTVGAVYYMKCLLIKHRHYSAAAAAGNSWSNLL